jgi:hypothetical protein
MAVDLDWNLGWGVVGCQCCLEKSFLRSLIFWRMIAGVNADDLK